MQIGWQMFSIDIKDIHLDEGESSTACCPIALSFVEKFLGTHPTTYSVWKKNGIPLMRGDVISVKTEHTRFWHPEKNKIYEFLHDQRTQDFIIEFDAWLENGCSEMDRPDETSITFKKPWHVSKTDKTLVEYFHSYNIPDEAEVNT